MLTLAKVTDGNAASAYYESADDYYCEDHAPSAWWGEGARLANLSGVVCSEDLKRLLDGEMPDGNWMHRGGEASRRAATDLTFSAPKSVSMQALIGGDERLVKAHEDAVTRSLAYIERNLAAYRVTTEGETLSIVSGNLLVAQFRHDLSRDTDPQLHTHAVALNATQRIDGQWRALDVAPFYAQQKFLGAYYRAELAREAQVLGYSVRLTHEDGRFELAHINDAQVAAFSRRSSAIESALAKLGKSRESASSREREIAALGSRQAKSTINRNELLKHWHEKSNALGVDYSAMVPTALTDTQRQQCIEHAVSFAIEHLLEREAVVPHYALASAALGQVTGVATFDEVERAIAMRVGKNELIEQDRRYTTVAAQATERGILNTENLGRDAVQPIIQQDWLSGTEGNNLNLGQREAARLILTTRNRIVGVQGRAGSGKTTMLGQVREASLANGWHCIGLAPSAAAAQELGTVGIEAQTIAAFLIGNGSSLNSKTVLIVDEAGMVSARDMQAVLAAVENGNAHAVCIFQ